MSETAHGRAFYDSVNSALPDGWRIAPAGNHELRLFGPDGPYATIEQAWLSDDVLLAEEAPGARWEFWTSSNRKSLKRPRSHGRLGRVVNVEGFRNHMRNAVLRALGPVQALLGGGPPAGLGQRIVQAMAARAMLLSARLDQAEGLLDLLERELDNAAEGASRVELWRLRGMLEQARRHPAEARAAFACGKEAARSAQSPLSEGLLELAHGQFLRKNGSRRAAIAALRVAGDLFGQLDARPFLMRSEVELTACGVRPRDHSGENRYGLTAREDVVARLVASGKSNRQVAEELYLSTKAIEYHLGNVFANVSVRSRHELAGRLGTPAADKR